MMIKIDFFEGNGFDRLMVKFCYGLFGNGVDLIGFGFVGLFIS